MPREHGAKSHEITARTFHFETMFHTGTLGVVSTLERALIHGEPDVPAWNVARPHVATVSK